MPQTAGVCRKIRMFVKTNYCMRIKFLLPAVLALGLAACTSAPSDGSLPRGKSPVDTAEFDKVFDDVTAVPGEDGCDA